MENHYSNFLEIKINIQSIFENLVSILPFNIRRIEFFVSSSPWEMPRPYVTPLERKQYGCLTQISIENRFSHRNCERFAVFRQLKMDKIVFGCDSRNLQGDVSNPGFEVNSSNFTLSEDWREFVAE